MTDPETPIQVTKMDAVHRQINTAIRMWFSDEDSVAIHTLVAAGHELPHTLFKRAGLSGLLFDSPVIREEFRSEIAKALKAPATFFKHAQRDPDATIAFQPGLNELILIYCVSGLDRMNEPRSVEAIALMWWLWIHKPNLFQVGHHGIPSDLLENLRLTGKTEFMQVCRDLAKLGLLPGIGTG